MLEIGRKLLQWDKITRSDLLSTENAIITNAFIEVWEAYRILTTDLKLRMQLSSYIKELKAKPYTYKTLVHKAQAHIFPLIDIGLISREKSTSNEVEFHPVIKAGNYYLKNLINSLQNIEVMENRFLNDEYFHVYVETFNIKNEKFNVDKHSKKLTDEIKDVYKGLRPYSPTFVSIPALSDVISARMINRYSILVERIEVEKMLDQLKVINTKDFHFHVDRGGRRNFLSITDNFLKK
jgi:hypothetical protein